MTQFCFIRLQSLLNYAGPYCIAVNNGTGNGNGNGNTNEGNNNGNLNGNVNVGNGNGNGNGNGKQYWIDKFLARGQTIEALLFGNTSQQDT